MAPSARGRAPAAERTPADTAVAPRRGRPRRVDLDTKRRSIIEAAVVVFGTEGRQRARLESIAARAGVSKAAMYELFESKDALFEAAADHEITRLNDHLLAAYARSIDAPFGTRTRQRYAAIFEYARSRPAGFAFLLLVRDDGSTADRRTRTRRSISAEMTTILRRELGAAGLPHDTAADVLAAVFSGMGEGAIRFCVDHPEVDPTPIIDVLADLTIAGLAGINRTRLEAIDDLPVVRAPAAQDEPT